MKLLVKLQRRAASDAAQKLMPVGVAQPTRLSSQYDARRDNATGIDIQKVGSLGNDDQLSCYIGSDVCWPSDIK